jgi:rRNA maturation protein Nop10
MNDQEFIPNEQVKECPVCRDWTLARYDHCPNCGFDISDIEPLDADELFHPEDY